MGPGEILGRRTQKINQEFLGMYETIVSGSAQSQGQPLLVKSKKKTSDLVVVGFPITADKS